MKYDCQGHCAFAIVTCFGIHRKMLSLLLFKVNQCVIILFVKRKKFSPKDWVTILYGEYKGEYGKVSMHDKDGRYGVIPYNKGNEPGTLILLEPESMERIKPYVLTEAALKKFLRGEKLYSDIAKDVFPPFNIKAKVPYELKAEDISQALTNINKSEDCLEKFKEWFWVIMNIFYEDLNIENRVREDFMSDAPENDDEIFAVAYGMAERLYWGLEERFSYKEEEEKYTVNFDHTVNWERHNSEETALEKNAYRTVCDDIISRVDSYVHNKDLPKEEWIYSSYQKKHIISGYESDDSLEDATDEALKLYRKFVRDLEEEGDIQALKVLAWGYYDGNEAFLQNWYLAEKYLLKLYLKSGDPYAANSLGYIYYYGRTNNGIPDYKKAFQYYCVGALAGIDESIYKAGDMLIYGRGIPKNIDMGLNMLIEGYRDSLARFCDGDFECKFADYALRMGNVCRDNLVYNMSSRDAYKFYLEAELAIKKRREKIHYIGDGTVEIRIKNELKRIRESTDIDPDAKELKADFPIYINQIYEDRFPVKVTLKIKKGAKTGTLKIERYRFGNEIGRLFTGEQDFEHIFHVTQTLLSFPELSWAELTSEITYHLEGVVVAQKSEKGTFFFSDGFRRNENTNALEFFYQGELVSAVEARWYVIKKKEKDDE